MNFLTHGGFLRLWLEQDRQMAGALANPRRSSKSARPIALDCWPLVRADRLDVEILADELVIVLRVRHCRLEQLAPIARDCAGGMSEDSSRLFDALSSDVVADQSSLASRGADVFGLCANLYLQQLSASTATAGRGARRRPGGRLGPLLLLSLGSDVVSGVGLGSGSDGLFRLGSLLRGRPLVCALSYLTGGRGLVLALSYLIGGRGLVLALSRSRRLPTRSLLPTLTPRLR